MKPLTLTLSAFGSYGQETVIDFTKPNQSIFLITGNTGSGKSTIFDALVFALYGETGSLYNKKSGPELQSQFGHYQKPPFVEFRFSRREGGEECIYTVRRIPRHRRPLRRGRGEREEKESVSLTMPDGREYSQSIKETNGKLVEIVGLDKNQFMQVAMIAQGEYMELLRARPEDKKRIFQKLFRTQPYQQLVDALFLKTKESRERMAEIQNLLFNEVSHIELPDSSEGEEYSAIQALKSSDAASEGFSPSDLDRLLEELEALCRHLAAKHRLAQASYEQAARERDRARSALDEGTVLLQDYASLEKASAEIAEGEEQKASMEILRERIRQIEGAYLIQTLHSHYQDRTDRLKREENAQGRAVDSLKGLREALEEAVRHEETASRAYEQSLTDCARTEKETDLALAAHQALMETEQSYIRQEAITGRVRQKDASAREDVSAFEELEKEWKKELRELEGADLRLLQLEGAKKEADEIRQGLCRLRKEEEHLSRQKKHLSQRQGMYARAAEAFEAADTHYKNTYIAYLSAQAGILARERLHPGEPCPVCGSCEHPFPCRIQKEVQGLTKESLDALAEKAQALRDDCSQKAEESRSLRDSIGERERILSDSLREYARRLEAVGISGCDAITLLEKLLPYQKALEDQYLRLSEQAAALANIRRQLGEADEKRVSLLARRETAAAELGREEAKLSGLKTLLTRCRREAPPHSQEEIRAILARARKKREAAALAEQAAKELRQTAATKQDACIAEIEGYEKNRPLLLAEAEAARKEYTAALEKQSLTEMQWKAVTEKFLREDAKAFGETIRRHETELAAAGRAFLEAKERIRGRAKPHMDVLKEAADGADARQEKARLALDKYALMLSADKRALHNLRPLLEERTKTGVFYQHVRFLYERLAGKVTGSRMDIETFVQRRYLESILEAANHRFADMSGGQFSLRLYDLDRAGEGKNRGLDLMVYSSVTGTLREVRTLSGGESFMAALSLALGMADRIQTDAAAFGMDFLFIDEGFGSLDEHARGQAVRVLQRMAGSSRLVGIISHVTELKQEMENQLIVEKDEDGSHVRWQIS